MVDGLLPRVPEQLLVRHLLVSEPGNRSIRSAIDQLAILHFALSYQKRADIRSSEWKRVLDEGGGK